MSKVLVERDEAVDNQSAGRVSPGSRKSGGAAKASGGAAQASGGAAPPAPPVSPGGRKSGDPSGGAAQAGGGTARGSGASAPTSGRGARFENAVVEEGPRQNGRPDTLNSEFLYYSSVLKLLGASLTNELDKQKIVPWVKKLFRPEYHSAQFREKRNKYLLFLTLTLLNDEAYGIFKTIPPGGALPEVEDLEIEDLVGAEWERDRTWQDSLENLSADFEPLTCSVHSSPHECNQDHILDKILDQEFQFLLYLMKPYAALLPSVFDRTRVATWMQTLCSISGRKYCSSMRGIRNDYIMALLGYVQNLRLVGPFAEYPPMRSLPPLGEAAKMAADAKPITDPANPEATDFLAQQPVPDEGAFCYIALTGDLIDNFIPTGPAGPRDTN